MCMYNIDLTDNCKDQKMFLKSVLPDGLTKDSPQMDSNLSEVSPTCFENVLELFRRILKLIPMVNDIYL